MAKEQVVEIKPLNIQRVEVEIIGDTPLITNRWSQKARQDMADKQQKKSRGAREAKDPEQCYLGSMYRFDDGRYGFPAGGFKAAIVGACRMFDSLPMTKAKIVIRVSGELNQYEEQLVEIISEPRMREDMVRNETGVADIRYRASFWPWRAKLSIAFNANVISFEQLYNLINAAGFGGVGEWRPSAPKSSSGDFGTFHVAES